MYRFKELSKAAKKDVQGKEFRLAVLGTCATQFLSTAIKGYAGLSDMNLKGFDADYNQIDAQLLDVSSETYSFEPDYILLYLATDKLYEEFMASNAEDREGFADRVLSRISSYWDMIEKNSKSKILQMGFSEINDKCF